MEIIQICGTKTDVGKENRCKKEEKTDVIKENIYKERMQMCEMKTDEGKENRCKKRKQV